VDTEQCIPTQHFNVPVLEVEGLVLGCGRGVIEGRLVVRNISDRSVDGKLVIGSICDREVGQGGNAEGRRMRSRRCRDHSVWLWDGGRFEWKRLRNLLRFGISAWKSQGCGNGSCSGVFLVRTSRLWFTGSEHGWRREALPATPP
jgi:hypothetical protein